MMRRVVGAVVLSLSVVRRRVSSTDDSAVDNRDYFLLGRAKT